jgi:hypothetical protein
VFLDSTGKTTGQGLMYLKCAHPDCSSDFDYGQGRLFRFHQASRHEQQPSRWHAVKHFWLCSRCCAAYTIEYQKGLGVLLMERLETLAGGRPGYSVLQAEAAQKPALPRRLGRRRVRQRSHESELAAAAAGAIEVLENRNLERRG